MSIDDYRDYFEEEEKPEPRPAGRWLGGLILGLILGGIIGFALGGGSLGSFFDDMQSSFDSESPWIVLTIIVVFGAAMLKSIGLRRNRFENAQAIRWVVMMMVLAIVLALGILFFISG